MAKATVTRTRAAEPAAAPVASTTGADLLPSGRSRHEDIDSAPKVATEVFVHAESTGPTGAIEPFPLHEIPLLKRKLEIQGSDMRLSSDWPEFAPRERSITGAELKALYDRLRARYTFKGNDEQVYDLVMDFYGPLHQGRLLKVMRAQHAAWRKASAAAHGEPLTIEALAELAELANPEADTIDADLLSAVN